MTDRQTDGQTDGRTPQLYRPQLLGWGLTSPLPKTICISRICDRLARSKSHCIFVCRYQSTRRISCNHDHKFVLEPVSFRLFVFYHWATATPLSIQYRILLQDRTLGVWALHEHCFDTSTFSKWALSIFYAFSAGLALDKSFKRKSMGL